MDQQLVDTVDRELWFTLSHGVCADVLEAYDPDWVWHFAGDHDAAYVAYRGDAEFQSLLKEYHESV